VENWILIFYSILRRTSIEPKVTTLRCFHNYIIPRNESHKSNHSLLKLSSISLVSRCYFYSRKSIEVGTYDYINYSVDHYSKNFQVQSWTILTQERTRRYISYIEPLVKTSGSKFTTILLLQRITCHSYYTSRNWAWIYWRRIYPNIHTISVYWETWRFVRWLNLNIKYPRKQRLDVCICLDVKRERNHSWKYQVSPGPIQKMN